MPVAPAPATGSGVKFSVDIDIDMKEMSGWTPEKVTAFFTGLAQVISAKGSIGGEV